MYEGPMPEVGGTVIYHDPLGKPHTALVTAVWGARESVGRMQLDPVVWGLPCVNLVFVSDDEARQDHFGRQIIRESSVVYRTSQGAHGRYYRFESDPVNPVVPVQT